MFAVARGQRISVQRTGYRSDGRQLYHFSILGCIRYGKTHTPAGGKKGKTLKILCIACIALLGIIDLFLVIAVRVLEKRV